MVSKNTAIPNLFWSFGERVAANGVSFVISIILARLLSPDEYGIISLILVFISIADVFVTNGFGASLIQKRNADVLDFSCVLVATVVISLIIYIVIWVLAPFIERFYNYNGVAVLMRVLALKVPIAAINGIQHAYVSKSLQFKKFFFATIIGTITSGIVGVFMAYRGYGAWSLVAQYLINALIDTIIIAVQIRIRFCFCFSFKRFKPLWSFGWRLTFAAVTKELYNQIRSLIIGKVYTASDLAYYNKGMQFPQLIVSNINTALGNVMFPVLSNVGNSKESVKAISQKFIKTTSYLIWPFMIGLAAVADTLVTVLLTEKWLESVFFLRIGAIAYAFIPLSTANLQAIKAMGRSDIIARNELVKRVLSILILFFSIQLGVKAIAISWLISLILCIIINMIPNASLLDYRFSQQIRDIMAPIGLSLLMGLVIYCLKYAISNTIILLVTQISSGIAIYMATSYVLKIDSFFTIMDYVRNLLERNK